MGYIDAFAGSGSIQLATAKTDELGLLEEEVQAEVTGLVRGSAARALALNPGFDGYVFLDTDPTAVAELRRLRSEHRDKNVQIHDDDANEYLQSICDAADWSSRRAVVFLDPAGMQVDWDTLESLARTGALDVWIWFPLGIGINRMLTRSGEIDPSWEARLNRIFGTNEWRDAFYRTERTDTLFGEADETNKIATPQNIAAFFNERLRTLFPAVATSPCIMHNSKNNPLYALCFASANPGVAAR